MIKRLLVLGGVLCALVLAGCSSRQFVKGKYDENVEDANLLTDKWSESDMQQAVKDLVASAVAHPAISAQKRPPIVMVTRLQNKTSEHVDTQSITDMFTVDLMRTGK
ncbi:MAG: penicillin-binding protein activator LpoB, partial [Bdellovibrionales bacterium]